MDEIHYFPAKEENEEMWPSEINNSVYKVFGYFPESDKLKTFARGTTPEEAGEELFQNIYQKTFFPGQVTNQFMKDEETIRQETTQEYGLKKSLASKIIPLENEEFEKFIKIRDKYPCGRQ